MNVNFKYNEPAEAEKIYFEQIFAEKPGGGIVGNVGVDFPPSTPVYDANGRYTIMPFFKVYETASSTSKSIKIEPTDIDAENMPVAFKNKAVNYTSIEKMNGEFHRLELQESFGVEIPAGSILYFAESAGPNAVVLGTPVFVTGDWVYANQGDQAVRLINGANLRKETANIASEVAALLPGINLV